MRNIKIAFMVLTACFAMLGVSHQQDFPHGNMTRDCQECHDVNSWSTLNQNAIFAHDQTGFPLIGSHKQIKCANCHKSLEFAKIGTACADCHPDIHHGQFGLDCQNCHSPQNWQNRQDIFQTHARKGFVLTGIHATLDCDACHINQQTNEYAGTPVDCKGCHENDFKLADNPDHLKAGFKVDCQQCHRPLSSNWQNVSYEHPVTFQLQGAHARVECRSCHSEAFAGVSHECLACHTADFQATQDPSHVALGFPSDCLVCHDQNQWATNQFNHLQASGYELTGAHASVGCVDCHVNNQYVGLPRNCYGCHQTDFEQVSQPNHVQGEFSHDCTGCHTDITWSPATFNHAQTRFPLTGAHTNLQCIQCHSAGYQNTPIDCYSCHQTNYNQANNPNHAQNNFDHNCTQCHTNVAWSPATFNHAQTRFPLTGAHTNLPCIQCHSAGYQNTPYDCYSCHQSDFNQVTDPNHVQNNFSHDCTLCHSTSAWDPATFDHSQTQFPLTGAHVTLQCVSCHSGGYTGTPTDCYTCHQSDYNGATNPNHPAAGFPHNCQSCHSTANWTQTTYNHDTQYFPIYSGSHAGNWTLCSDCHTNSSNFAIFECINCHEHNQIDTDNDHREVTGYQYLSTACYTCHPRGR